jgi:Raf kinase inhibitor-like YbhB/YbcL family protein
MAAAASLLVSGCGLLAGPQRLSEDPSFTMTVTIPVLTDGVLPAEYTCYARHPGSSPPISWSGAPPGTRSLALVVDDSSTPIAPRVYWLVFDIRADTTDLQARTVPPGARVAQNTAHKAAYDPPCPSGAPHRYRVTIYALNIRFSRQALPPGAPLLQAWATVSAHVIGRGIKMFTACPAPQNHGAVSATTRAKGECS